MGNVARESESEVRVVRDTPEDVVRDAPEVVVRDAPEVVVRDAPEGTEEFGLRVVWQSEDERLQAAAFLVATRMQEDVRRRVAKTALDLREQNREKFSSYVAEHNGD